mmetsp:Transcript_6009/g.11655  ORF Transcript_6009/g.11655 Transcript_6009/m.11655 type:complete len:200 (-) Transcript_6009:803-1402(-)
MRALRSVESSREHPAQSPCGTMSMYSAPPTRSAARLLLRSRPSSDMARPGGGALGSRASPLCSRISASASGPSLCELSDPENPPRPMGVLAGLPPSLGGGRGGWDVGGAEGSCLAALFCWAWRACMVCSSACWLIAFTSRSGGNSSDGVCSVPDPSSRAFLAAPASSSVPSPLFSGAERLVPASPSAPTEGFPMGFDGS